MSIVSLIHIPMYITCIFFPCFNAAPSTLSTQNKHSPFKSKMCTHRLASFDAISTRELAFTIFTICPSLYLATISIMGHVRKLRSVVADLRVKFYTGTVPCKPAKRLPPSGKILPTVSRGVTRAIPRTRMRATRIFINTPATVVFTDILLFHRAHSWIVHSGGRIVGSSVSFSTLKYFNLDGEPFWLVRISKSFKEYFARKLYRSLTG